MTLPVRPHDGSGWAARPNRDVHNVITTRATDPCLEFLSEEPREAERGQARVSEAPSVGEPIFTIEPAPREPSRRVVELQTQDHFSDQRWNAPRFVHVRTALVALCRGAVATILALYDWVMGALLALQRWLVWALPAIRDRVVGTLPALHQRVIEAFPAPRGSVVETLPSLQRRAVGALIVLYRGATEAVLALCRGVVGVLLDIYSGVVETLVALYHGVMGEILALHRGVVGAFLALRNKVTEVLLALYSGATGTHVALHRGVSRTYGVARWTTSQVLVHNAQRILLARRRLRLQIPRPEPPRIRMPLWVLKISQARAPVMSVMLVAFTGGTVVGALVMWVLGFQPSLPRVTETRLALVPAVVAWKPPLAEYAAATVDAATLRTTPVEQPAPAPLLVASPTAVMPEALTVTSTPAGARVTVDGIGWGETPVTIRNLPSGQKVVRVTKEGYQSQQTIVSVADGRSKPVSVTLRATN